MVSVMNDYISKIKLQSDEIMRGILNTSLKDLPDIEQVNIQMKSNKFIVDVKLIDFSIDKGISIMNHFMENTRFHYSAYYIRYNEGNLLRYRYASCKENREGFYCDVVIS